MTVKESPAQFARSLLVMDVAVVAAVASFWGSAFGLRQLLILGTVLVAANAGLFLGWRRSKGMPPISPRTHALLVNGAVLCGLLLTLWRAPLAIVALSAAILFPAANLGLYVRRRRLARTIAQAKDQAEGTSAAPSGRA